MKPEVKKFKPSYKLENGISVLDLASIKLPVNFEVKYNGVVHFPPSTTAGNHKHPREEMFFGFGELVFYYLDDKLNLNSINFENKDGTLNLIRVPSFLVHAVKNISEKDSAFLYEFVNDVQHDVEKMKIID